MSDWSSDVCSSDLSRPHRGNVRHEVAGWERTAANRVSGETDPLEHAVDRAPFVVEPGEPVGRASLDDDVDAVALAAFIQGGISYIGRASCRERVCQYV